jgi:hypothetical protein
MIDHVTRVITVPLLLLSCSTRLPGQSEQAGASINLATGTAIYVQLDRNFPMRIGQVVRAHVSYPVYVGGQLALSPGAVATGHIDRLAPARRERRAAKWNADFTPYRSAELVFDQIEPSRGSAIGIDSMPADQGVQVLKIVPKAAAHHSIIRDQLEAVKSDAKGTVRLFTAPDKADRLKQALWYQLPWHPQRLTKDSEWSFELFQPVSVPASRSASNPISSPEKLEGARTLCARLQRPIDSKTDHKGTAIEAIVLAPLYGEDHRIEVPQGAILAGTITEAKAARWFGRDGKLRFAFRSVRYSEDNVQAITGTTSAASTDAEHPLTMDAEGGLKPAPRDRLLRPLLSAALANSALDEEASNAGLNAAASGSFGLIGRAAGAAGSSPEIAAGIGYYTAAREIYLGWIARGRDVRFAQNTRIEITIQPRPGTILTSNETTKK